MKFGITIQLPKTDENGKAMFHDKENKIPAYETNWFCCIMKHPTKPDVELIEWDTDVTYARKFESKMQAKSYAEKIIKEPEGIEIKPINIK